jgi:hypothetical protein
MVLCNALFCCCPVVSGISTYSNFIERRHIADVVKADCRCLQRHISGGNRGHIS